MPEITSLINLSFACFSGQRMEIDINHEAEAEPEEQETALSSVTVNKSLLASILGCLLLLIISIAIFVRFLERPDRSQQTTSAAAVTTSIATTPTTPDRSSPGVVNEMSPRTPQPFVDYVRRTIDETPHYKREARRRVNPQNTF